MVSLNTMNVKRKSLQVEHMGKDTEVEGDREREISK